MTVPTTTLSHAAYLTEQIRIYQHYLDHADPAARLMGLHAMAEYIDKLITTDYASAARRPRFITRIRRFLHALAHYDWRPWRRA